MCGLFLIFLDLSPNLSVDNVSSALTDEGEQLMSSVVLEFPPSESCRSLVSLESR